MRTRNLIPLALVLSLAFAGCAQVHQRPALVMGTLGTFDLTDGMATEDGFDIAGLDLARGGGACRVEVKLRGVYYGGEDIGSKWNFSGSVNSRTWHSGQQEIRHGTWHSMDLSIFDNINKRGCLTTLLFLDVAAEHPDAFPDRGTHSAMTAIRCLPEMSRRKLFVPVSVVAVPYSAPDPDKVARLYFFFEITSVCLTP